MSVYQHGQQESPWAILDPSLKQHTLFLDSTEKTRPSYLEFPTTLIETPIQFEQEKKVIEEKDPSIQDYLNEIKEIESELIHHRNSIYSEKLKALQTELLSIEQETHKTIIKQDKKAERKRDRELQSREAMYKYQLESIEKQADAEKLNILQDIKRNEEFARRVLTSERNGTTLNNKKRKEKSPSTTHSDTDDSSSDEEHHHHQQVRPAFKKIHLSKQISKLQAISDRQRTSKSNKQKLGDALHVTDQDELDNDLLLIKKNIINNDVN